MILNEEQRLFQETLAAFLAERANSQHLRALRERPAHVGFDADLWQALVEMGLPLITVPEQHNGLAVGWLAAGAVAGTIGRELSATPFLSSVVLAQELLIACGSPAQIDAYLPALLDGTETWSVAMNEGNGFNPEHWSRWPGDTPLTVRKTMVMEGAQADRLLVVNNNGEGGFSVFLLTPSAEGAQVEPQRLMDGRQYARLDCRDVLPEAVEWLEGDGVAVGCQRVLDCATAILAAEMVGGARALQEMTVRHLCEREQFGRKIGSFQALQHRAAQLYAEVELAQSAVQAALVALDRGQADAGRHCSAAKALAGDCLQLASDEAVQLHGGMGVTDEMDVGLFLKRSRVCNQLLGTSAWHRARYASLVGF